MAASLQLSVAVDSPRNAIVFDDPRLDEVTLIGLDKEEALRRLGAPDEIAGPEDGYQTYEYRKPQRLSVVFLGGKLVQYVVSADSKARTAKGIQLGSYLGSVAKEYGDFSREEEVTEWFGGTDSQVLYHHTPFDRFKLIYPQADLIFQFNGDKTVELIWVGFPAK